MGIAGLIGAGRSELVETLFGIRKRSAGEVLLEGKPVEIRHPKHAVNAGIALITEDRKGTGRISKERWKRISRWCILTGCSRQVLSAERRKDRWRKPISRSFG